MRAEAEARPTSWKVCKHGDREEEQGHEHGLAQCSPSYGNSAITVIRCCEVYYGVHLGVSYHRQSTDSSGDLALQ